MNNTSSSILRLIITAICSITVIMYSGYNLLFDNSGILISNTVQNPNSENTQNENIDTPSSKDETVSTTPPPAENNDSTVTDNTQSDSVPTASPSKVLGKVSKKFISPYAANTSFNSVYLKNSTDLNIDLKTLLSANLPYKIQKNSNPQVLIIHTHTTEAFMHEDRDYYTDKDLSRTLDENYNVVRLGNIITEKLNNAGIKTIHDTTKHDYPEYNGSYDRAAVTIKKNLKKYPDIKIVIDLHRDAIGGGKSDKVKPVTEINGKKAAQVMLVMGSQSGYVKNHPKWEENLKLAVRLQQNLEIMYPTLARALSLMPRLYNENLTTGSMLLEIGTDSNSIDEVVYSAELVGEALVKTLNALQ